MKKITAIILLLITLCLCFIGCGEIDQSSKEAENARALVNALVEYSYELNVIYYGEGMSIQDEEEGDGLYSPVTSDSNYLTRYALESRTREIFCNDLANTMIKMAFEGEQGGISTTAVLARYIEYNGHLSARIDYEPMKVTKYDYTSTIITKISERFIQAEIKSVNLEENKYFKITLINEENGWRLYDTTC
jgi:hypothetical protein